MGKNMKFVVAVGAVLGIVGFFMPITKATEALAAAAKGAAKEMAKTPGAGAAMAKLGGGGALASLTGSLWDAREVPVGSIKGIVWGTLGGFALLLIFAVLGIAKGFTRGIAALPLLVSLALTGLCAMFVMGASKHGGAAMGAFLMVGGAGLAFIGSLLTMIKPEQKA